MTMNVQPIFKGIPICAGISFASGDTTTKKTLINAVVGTYPNGLLIEDINVCSDDTAAVNLAFYLYDGTTDFHIGNVNIPIGSGYTTVALVKALRTLEPDLGFISLPVGWQIRVNCVATMTAAKICTITFKGGSMSAAA